MENTTENTNTTAEAPKTEKKPMGTATKVAIGTGAILAAGIAGYFFGSRK